MVTRNRCGTAMVTKNRCDTPWSQKSPPLRSTPQRRSRNNKSIKSKKGEHEQPVQFHKQGVFGDPFDPSTRDPDAIFLSPTWQHTVKDNAAHQDFSAMETKELPQSSMQLHPLGHVVWKCPSRGHFWCFVLLEVARFMEPMFKTTKMHMARLQASRHT